MNNKTIKIIAFLSITIFVGCREGRTSVTENVISAQENLQLIVDRPSWVAYKLKVDSTEYIIVWDRSAYGGGIGIVKHSK